MKDRSIDIVFENGGLDYKGWATPSVRLHKDGKPASYHVVLNEIMFGNVSFNGEHWVVDEQRPAALVEKVGALIETWEQDHQGS